MKNRKAMEDLKPTSTGRALTLESKGNDECCSHLHKNGRRGIEHEEQDVVYENPTSESSIQQAEKQLGIIKQELSQIEAKLNERMVDVDRYKVKECRWTSLKNAEMGYKTSMDCNKEKLRSLHLALENLDFATTARQGRSSGDTFDKHLIGNELTWLRKKRRVVRAQAKYVEKELKPTKDEHASHLGKQWAELNRKKMETCFSLFKLKGYSENQHRPFIFWQGNAQYFLEAVYLYCETTAVSNRKGLVCRDGIGSEAAICIAKQQLQEKKQHKLKARLGFRVCQQMFLLADKSWILLSSVKTVSYLVKTRLTGNNKEEEEEEDLPDF
ncbi:hypothetical protein TIFTF001_022953 [Ficus carica]|uniref:Uncharacterized protein n=1 Tax=Ficus carica TaxID=3494 RepID=A0AA88AU47_FICCA|nr:hypothetical protein TIFTF001_022953 [Ficus carica]